MARDPGVEEIGGDEVRVGAAPGAGGGRDHLVVGVEEEREERRRVERAEAAAEGRGRADGAEEGPAGEGGTDEAR